MMQLTQQSGASPKERSIIDHAFREFGVDGDEVRLADFLKDHIPTFTRAHWRAIERQNPSKDHWMYFRVMLGAPPRYEDAEGDIFTHIGARLADRYAAVRGDVYKNLAALWSKTTKRWSPVRARQGWVCFYSRLFEDWDIPDAEDIVDEPEVWKADGQFVADVTRDVIRRTGSPDTMWENQGLVHSAITGPFPRAALQELERAGANLRPNVPRRVSSLAAALTVADPDTAMFLIDRGCDIDQAIEELGGLVEAGRKSSCLDAVQRTLRARTAATASEHLRTRGHSRNSPL